MAKDLGVPGICVGGASEGLEGQEVAVREQGISMYDFRRGEGLSNQQAQDVAWEGPHWSLSSLGPCL